MKESSKLPETYINKKARRIKIQDQKERETSVGICAAYLLQLQSEEQ